MATPSQPPERQSGSVRVLRIPAGDERPHLINLELIPNISHGWDTPVPNVLVFWSKEGWRHRRLIMFPSPDHLVSKFGLYQTMWRGDGCTLPLNKYYSDAKRKIYGDAFFVAMKTDRNVVPVFVEYRNLLDSFMGTGFVRSLIEQHDAYDARCGVET